MTHSFSSLLTSVINVDELRGFSAAAARKLRKDPSLGEKIRVKPTPSLNDLVFERNALFVQSAAFEATHKAPLKAARAWSDFADRALARAYQEAYDLTSRDRGAPFLGENPLKLALFALGKLGSQELNPSSDVDLLVVYEKDGLLDEGKGANESAHEWAVAWVQTFRALLDGSHSPRLFRVDLDLRPEGRTGALANSVSALERYYESFGRIWERAALTRLRFVAGDASLAQNVCERLRPFVFPKNTSANTMRALAEMKADVSADAKRSARIGMKGFDVKRGEGGIREIEFIVVLFQLLHGGRNERLRFGSVVELLEILENNGHLSHDDATQLREDYVTLRQVEHALQYREDRQTQWIRDSDPLHERLPESLAELRARVHKIFTDVFEQDDAHDRRHDLARRVFDSRLSDEEREDAMASLGFIEVKEAFASFVALTKKRASPFSNAHAHDEKMQNLAREWLLALSQCEAPELALSRCLDVFSRFVSHASLRALGKRKEAVHMIVRALAKSARLSKALPQRFDELFVEPIHHAPSRMRLQKVLTKEASFEDSLLWMRHVHANESVRSAIEFINGDDNAASVFRHAHRLSTLADALIERALEVAVVEVSRRVPKPEGARFAICALGRLGGRELGLFSDLDLVFFFDSSNPGLASHWASKVAQKVMSALSVPMQNGRCYEIDARLRPSGNQGALVTSLDAFERYHANQSQVWERQSLLRLRCVAGDETLMREVRQSVRGIVSRKSDHGLGLELRRMLKRIHSERAKEKSRKRRGEFLDVKLGEGGAMDIAFAVQGIALFRLHENDIDWLTSIPRMLKRARKRSWIDNESAELLFEAQVTYSQLRENMSLRLEGAPGVMSRAHAEALGLEFESLGKLMQDVSTCTQEILAGLVH